MVTTGGVLHKGDENAWEVQSLRHVVGCIVPMKIPPLMKSRLILSALALPACQLSAGPLKAFVLAGQSNMEGQAGTDLTPESRETVRFVPTRDFVRKAEDSPNPGHGHHEFGNAETYFLVGDALAKGMLKLQSSPSAKP